MMNIEHIALAYRKISTAICEKRNGFASREILYSTISLNGAKQYV